MATPIPSTDYLPPAAAANDRPREECGVCGIYGHPYAAKITYFGLFSLQHRGQESAGIVVSDGEQIRQHKGMGLVPEVFSEEDLGRLQGHLAVGHVRYSTTGASHITNAQPFVATHRGSTLAVAHNGNLVNIRSLRDELESQGSIFQSTMDSEVVVHLLARCLDMELDQAIVETFRLIKGAYSILLMTKDKLVAVRDPGGFRPLCLGRLNNGSYIVASETCALDLVEAQYIRDVEPGEVLIIDQQGLRSLHLEQNQPPSFCIFEHVYFARPDSDIFGINVYQSRKRMGEILARECPIEADLVMPFPDSGNYAAIGYAQASGIPLEMGVIRNHYVGRTFIQPTQSMRDFSVRVKLNPIRSFLENKRVIIMEDSIIRGTTARSRVQSLRGIGVKEVHMVISCPPTRNPCYYGIDFPSCEELVANQKTVEQIRDYLDLDTLYYLSLEGLVEATGAPAENFCKACFDGNYPVPPDRDFRKNVLGCGGSTLACPGRKQ
ncbi:amidophosphoribosyltransferase [Desulfurivibrio alkaliphilus]|uniref:Amidophosphoribosyltransferase n=1 Tax=Desulfurivibrio alkaliphilus (strain DSM 19089 / UNIQEM U267 / AHT2) TaxID=589865 RepID=D6Z454_DESAT|nr:amidophosphoribosyltransferase [Desulfurivibrio alkaliphilus]ADH86329.1 amidophosphoribosyltransferase [Desulfurivibrio alkaliphilus AHT 2]